MWIFTETGFVSAVQHREDPNTLVVRARDRASLEHLQVALDAISEGASSPIEHTPTADYPYRLYTDRLFFARWAAHMARDISYSNFKGQCYQTLPEEYSNALHDVWSAMHQVEDDEARVGQEEAELLHFPSLRSALE